MKIGEAFIKAGLINENNLKIALKKQEKNHARLGDIIIQEGWVSADRIGPVLAEYFQIPYIDLKKIYKDINPETLKALPEDLAHRFHVIPIELKGNVLTVVIADPLDLMAMDTLRIKTGFKIRCVLAPEKEISEALEYCYRNLEQMGTYIDNFINIADDKPYTSDETDDQAFGAGDQPVVQYVKSLIIHAYNNRASDIILQPKQSKADLRFRIDGILYHFDSPPKIMLSAIITRIKILSGLDIAERRLPQDGRFKVVAGQSTIDIRTSIFPTIYGESIVLRLLDTSQPLLGIDKLGMDEESLQKFKHLLQHSYGLILVTGPTGSGKTTTLYTALNEIKTAQRNILTLEDPVEYRMPFMQQSQVNPQIGFTFAKGLRSILRQDPDIIMVGEIRDKETAEIAVHAALTGHLVFSTLHTNDAAGAIARLTNMGIEPFLISSSLLGVIAQRLIRGICPGCRESYESQKEILQKINGESKTITTFYRGRGCANCLESGYRGRSGIYELLLPNQAIRQCILQNRSSDEIRKIAQQNGMKTLRQVSIEKLRAGITTPEEVLRVTQETEE